MPRSLWLTPDFSTKYSYKYSYKQQAFGHWWFVHVNGTRTWQCCKKKLRHGTEEMESWWWGQKFVRRLKKLQLANFIFTEFISQILIFLFTFFLVMTPAVASLHYKNASLTDKTNHRICTFSQEAPAAPAILSKKFFYQCHHRRILKYTQKVRPGKKFVPDTDYVEQPFLTCGHGTPSVPWTDFRGFLNVNGGKKLRRQCR